VMMQHSGDTTDDPEFAGRLRLAAKALELATGRDISQEELGQLVGKEMQREPFTGVAVHRWLKGRRPNYEIMAALSRVLGVRKGWLAFGEGEAGEGVKAELIRRSIESAVASKEALRQAQKSATPGRKRSNH
jgi:transcriptional regulator with XRE-family HTH domain